MLATVKGDGTDIGKNLVDIILSNNGYTVVNLGIKQPISTIIDAAEESGADAIGMSGLLVKSTVVMKENLEEMNQRGVAARWPVLLGGAAHGRAYVEDDLASLAEGEVRYARDAFEGLRLMDAVVSAKHDPKTSLADALPALRKRRVSRRSKVAEPAQVTTSAPTWPPTTGADAAVLGQSRRSRPASGRLCGLPRRAGDVSGPVGAARDPSWPTRSLVEAEGRPATDVAGPSAHRGHLGSCRRVRVLARGLRRQRPRGFAADDHEKEIARFRFPRQRRDRRLCLADFFRPRESGELDVVAFHLVTVGSRVAEATASSSRRMPTATTWSCTGCRSSSPRRWRSTGMHECGQSWASVARTPTTWPGSLIRPIAGRGTRSAIRPARTWPTGPRSCACWNRSGSA